MGGEIQHGLVKRIEKSRTSYFGNIMSMLVLTYLPTGMT
jgi:hypothetical protein